MRGISKGINEGELTGTHEGESERQMRMKMKGTN